MANTGPDRMTASAADYRADIDGLRAIAILLVCIFHFQLLPLGQAGFIGVDVFFVISGFLITRIILRGLETNSFSLRQFYYRRIRRLYPALLATLILYLAVAYILFLPRLFDELAWETFFSSIYAINFYLWKSVDYFGFHAHGKPLLHMWSLAVEEQFYLIYPVFLLLIWRGLRARLLLVLSLTVLASFALGWFASLWKPQAAFYLLPTRAWELGAGGILALVMARHPLPAPLLQAAGPAAFALLGLALFIHYPEIAFPGWFAVLPVGAAMLFILGGTAPNAPVTRLLSSAPMVFFGKISYPLYLVHWPVKIILNDVLPGKPAGLGLGGFALSILLATLIWRYIETPLRSGRVLKSPPAFLGATGGCQALVLAASVAIFSGAGLPDRFSPEVQHLLSLRRNMPQEFSHCEFSKGGVQTDCRIGAPQTDPEMIVIGDSHSFALAGALDLWLRAQGKSAILSYGNGCLPVRGAGRLQCLEFTRTVFDLAETLPVKTVMIASAWTQPYDGGGHFYEGRFLRAAAGLEAFETGLKRTIERLHKAGKAVILVDPMYWARHSVPETLARNAAFGMDWALDITRAEYDQRFAHLLDLFGTLEGPQLARVSLIEELCASGTCPALREGAPVFVDATHMARRLEHYFADVLARELPPS